MLTFSNPYEGMPPRLYRRPSEIQDDIAGIKEKVGEIENMLSVRGLLLDLITTYSGAKPETWVPELEAAVEEARSALDSLHILNDTLRDLKDELGEVRCIMKM